MGTERSASTRKLALFAMLGLADLALTLALIHQSQGRVYESNPIAGAWLASYGSAGLALFKLLAMSVVGASALMVSRYRPRAGGRLLQLACGITGAVVCYSVMLLGQAGRPAPDRLVLRERPMAEVRWGEATGLASSNSAVSILDR